jgi:hypothetical protein
MLALKASSYLKQTHRLIRTSCRRHIRISTQIDKELLICTNQPRTQIRPGNTRNGPLYSIATKGKRPIRILRRIKRNRQLRLTPALRHDIRIQHPALDELDELAGHDLELPSGGVGVEDCGAGGVLWFGLEVFMEIGGFDCADPVVARLEGGSGVRG